MWAVVARRRFAAVMAMSNAETGAADSDAGGGGNCCCCCGGGSGGGGGGEPSLTQAPHLHNPPLCRRLPIPPSTVPITDVRGGCCGTSSLGQSLGPGSGSARADECPVGTLERHLL